MREIWIQHDVFKATFGKCLKEVRRFLNKDQTRSIVELSFNSTLTAEKVIFQRNIKIVHLSLPIARKTKTRKAYFSHVCKCVNPDHPPRSCNQIRSAPCCHNHATETIKETKWSASTVEDTTTYSLTMNSREESRNWTESTEGNLIKQL